jgi:hypothetical protein
VRLTEQAKLTSGWPAGRKLLLQLENPDSPPAANGQVVSGSALFDYLGEAFDDRSEEARGFLLKLAHLPRITLAMAGALADSPEAPQILAVMHADNCSGPSGRCTTGAAARASTRAAAAESGSKLARENGLRMWDFLLGALQV